MIDSEEEESAPTLRPAFSPPFPSDSGNLSGTPPTVNSAGGGYFDEPAAVGTRSLRQRLAASVLGQGRPTLKITFGDKTSSFVPSYTTLERIEGTVEIKAPFDIPLEDFQISFVGRSQTEVEKLSHTAPTNNKSVASHQFLKLVQPLATTDEALPSDGVLTKDKTWTIPFLFVVPDRLLPRACRHVVRDAHTTDAHLNLPPSFGDHSVAGEGERLLKDLAPPETVITYAIKGTIFGCTGAATNGDLKAVVLHETQKKVRIIPRVTEEPPLVITDDMPDYTMRRTKKIKRGIFSREHVGNITVEVSQPPSIHLNPCFLETQAAAVASGQQVIESSTVPIPTTTAVVNATFTPLKPGATPPKFSRAWGRLKVLTFWSSRPLVEVSHQIERALHSTVHGVQVETIPLTNISIENVAWSEQASIDRRTSTIDASPRPANPMPTPTSMPSAALSPTITERESVQPSTSTDEKAPLDEAVSPGTRTRTRSRSCSPTTQLPSPSLPLTSPGPSSLTSPLRPSTAQISIPLSLPQCSKNTFLPTFHTCLISRVYSVEITIQIHPSKSLTLRTPIQISHEGNPLAEPIISEEEATALLRREELQFGDLLAARSMSFAGLPSHSTPHGVRTGSIAMSSIATAISPVPEDNETASESEADPNAGLARSLTDYPHLRTVPFEMTNVLEEARRVLIEQGRRGSQDVGPPGYVASQAAAAAAGAGAGSPPAR